MRRCLPLLTLLAILLLPGCSLLRWGGDMAAKAPGVHVESGGLFPARLDVTSDCNAVVDRLEYQSPPGKDGTPGPWLVLEGGRFGQDATTPLKEIPAVLERLPEIQRTQAEYAQVWADCTENVLVSAISAFAPAAQLGQLAKLSKTERGITMTLPNGASIGGRTVSGVEDVAALFREAQAASAALQAELARRKGASAAPESNQ